jgi:hypothetical protein
VGVTFVKEQVYDASKGGIAPELASGVTAEQWAQIIGEVDDQVGLNAWGGNQDRCNRAGIYLAAHLGTLRKSAAAGIGGQATPGGPLTGVSVGQVSKQFATPGAVGAAGFSQAALMATAYGIEFLRLRRMYCARAFTT